MEDLVPTDLDLPKTGELTNTVEPTTDSPPVDEILDALFARIQPVKDASKWRKIVIYGGMGVGKTTFASGAPKPLLINIERGALTLAENNITMDVLEYKSLNQVNLLIEKMGEDNALSAKYDTLIFDTFSDFQQRALKGLVQQAASGDASRNPYVPEGKDYQFNTEQMKEFITRLRDLPKHVIFICHDKEEKTDTGRILVRPDLTPKIATHLGGAVDLVGYATRDTVEGEAVYRLQVHPTDRIAAKSRISGLPSVIESPTWDNLMKKDS